MIILTPVFMYVSNIGASGGEQKPLTTLATMIVVTIYGAAIISVLTPFLFKEWFKKNWWWFCFIIGIAIFPTIKDIWEKHSQSPYASSEINTTINGNEIRTKTEFYDDFKTIRSVSFWKNGQKDSVWKTFSREGKIIEQQTFNNDTLVHK